MTHPGSFDLAWHLNKAVVEQSCVRPDKWTIFSFCFTFVESLSDESVFQIIFMNYFIQREIKFFSLCATVVHFLIMHFFFKIISELDEDIVTTFHVCQVNLKLLHAAS